MSVIGLLFLLNGIKYLTIRILTNFLCKWEEISCLVGKGTTRKARSKLAKIEEVMLNILGKLNLAIFLTFASLCI